MNCCAQLIRSSRWPSSSRLLNRFSSTLTPRPPQIGSSIPLGDLPELGDSEVRFRALVRGSDLSLREKVLGTNEPENQSSLVLLSGPRGSGKTTSLQSSITAARKSGCVVLYIPRASSWTHGDGFFAAARGEEDKPKNEKLPIRWYDRPFQTSRTLKDLLKSHASQMETVPCGEHGTTRVAAEKALEIVENLDDDWRLMPRKAGNLFSAILESLASYENMRFVVAIDEYECFVGLSELGNERGRYVHASGISAVGRHFGRDAIQPFAKSMRNGVVVLSKSDFCNGRQVRASRVLGTTDFELSEQVKKDPNGSKWLEEMWAGKEKGKEVVQFEKFTMDEMQAILEVGQKHSDAIAEADSDVLQRVALLAGGRGDVLQKLVGSM